VCYLKISKKNDQKPAAAKLHGFDACEKVFNLFPAKGWCLSSAAISPQATLPIFGSILKIGKNIFLFTLLARRESADAGINEHDGFKKDCRGTKNCFIKPFFWQRNPTNSGGILNFESNGVS